MDTVSSHTRALLLTLALLDLLYFGRPFDARPKATLSNRPKLQTPRLVNIGSPVAPKVAHICLLAEPAAELNRPLDPGCSPGQSQPALPHNPL